MSLLTLPPFSWYTAILNQSWSRFTKAKLYTQQQTLGTFSYLEIPCPSHKDFLKQEGKFGVDNTM